MNIKRITKDKKKKDLIIQANNGDTLFKLYEVALESPLSKRQIKDIFGVNLRQVDYYSEALGSMEIGEWIKYRRKPLFGIRDNVKAMSRKDFANFLDSKKYIKKQIKLLKSSSLAAETKKRRESSIKAIEKWVGENK